MGLASGSLYIVLILDSVLLGPLLQNTIFYGMKVAMAPDALQNKEHALTGFVVYLAVTFLQLFALLGIARALAARSWLWLLPYAVWKPITLLGGGALLGALFWEEELHLVTDADAPSGHAPPPVVVPNALDKYGFVNHATGFVWNTYGAGMAWADFRDTVLVPPLAAGLAVGLVSLLAVLAAAAGFRASGVVGEAESVELDADSAYMRQYEMTHLANGNGNARVDKRA